ncbi:MAG: DUF2213 domain-containing protein [Spirochaetaceae bacterium]|jgi:hypothetical protein|nr:DUF2213 domain-containing protein [Spirochaetaceae bacterium]
MAEQQTVKTVKRLDSLDPSRWMTTPFTRTPEGFLTGRAIVTSVGVFTYLNKDGTKTSELRLPDDVFNSASLESMKLKPVVNSHPDELVTDGNVKKYQVGSLGSNPSSTVQERNYDGFTPLDKLTDGFHVAIDMIINDADTINDVLNGKRALSMGYECEIEVAEPGSVWCGVAYDGIQRNIRYNHAAIEDGARAGDAARIRMDGADFGPGDAVQINHTDASGADPSPKPKEGKNMGMKKINLDGVEYEGEEKLIQFYQDQKKRADAAEKDLEKARADSAEAKTAVSKMEAERDAQKDRADTAEKELKEAKDQALDPKRLDEAVNARVLLFDAADRAGVEIKDGMTDLDIKKAVISAVSPTAKLDGKDEVYIAARFDAAVEILGDKADGESRAVGGGLPPTASRNDAAAARQRMIERMKSRGRGEKEGG